MMTVEDIESLIANLRALSRYENDDLSLAADAADLIDAMAGWLKGDCECPCCLGVTHCKTGCTFAEDAPADAERMANVREVLFG